MRRIASSPRAPVDSSSAVLTGEMIVTDYGSVDEAGYNYPYFDKYIARGGHDADEALFRASPHAGDPAESFTLTQLDDGAQVRLADLWKSKPLVMEFGSFT